MYVGKKNRWKRSNSRSNHAPAQTARQRSRTYPPSLAVSARSLAYAVCNVSILAPIYHWK